VKHKKEKERKKEKGKRKKEKGKKENGKRKKGKRKKEKGKRKKEIKVREFNGFLFFPFLSSFLFRFQLFFNFLDVTLSFLQTEANKRRYGMKSYKGLQMLEKYQMKRRGKEEEKRGKERKREEKRRKVESGKEDENEEPYVQNRVKRRINIIIYQSVFSSSVEEVERESMEVFDFRNRFTSVKSVCSYRGKPL